MRFTVIIPVYNRRQILPRALQSIRLQTFPDFEVIVVDDGSADDPATIVASLMDERFRCVVQENAGAAAARNAGARLAKGDVITFLDSDDEALPTWLESMDQAFEQRGVVIVCCGLEKTDGKRTWTHFPEDMGKLFNHARARFTNGGVFAMRRETFDKVEGYDENVRSGEHTELAMRLLPIAQKEGWKIHNIMRPLVRIHVHNGARMRSNSQAIYLGSTYVLEKHKGLFEKDARKYSDYHAVAGVNAARMGLFVEARYHLLKSALVRPFSLKSWVRIVLAYIPGFMSHRWRKSQ